jgi:hypothetical protein
VTSDEYCREIEAYLCRKNDGHLIRIVGPSFERVCGWSTQGIPLKIACQGIDNYFARYYAKGPRRRPVQIDFCEADVLDAFDAWRRAVGVRRPGVETSEDAAAGSRRRGLPEHLKRVLEKITSRLAGTGPLSPSVRQTLESIADEVSSLGDLPGPFRGEARARISARLLELDRTMLDAVRNDADPALLQTLRREAADQLAPFRERMPAKTYEHAIETAVDGLLRDRERVPTIAFD